MHVLQKKSEEINYRKANVFKSKVSGNVTLLYDVAVTS